MINAQTLHHVAAEDARAAFAASGAVVVPGLVDPVLCDYLRTYALCRFASAQMGFGDRQVSGTPASYGDPAFDALLAHLRLAIEAVAGAQLVPTYSYFRIYKHGDALRRHRDRPACEISVSIAIDRQSTAPWPLWIESRTVPIAADLMPGDALVYRGHELPHWREPFAGQQQIQVFLHYVYRDGPLRDLKYDGRPALMLPAVDGHGNNQT